MVEIFLDGQHLLVLDIKGWEFKQKSKFKPTSLVFSAVFVPLSSKTAEKTRLVGWNSVSFLCYSPFRSKKEQKRKWERIRRKWKWKWKGKRKGKIVQGKEIG